MNEPDDNLIPFPAPENAGDEEIEIPEDVLFKLRQGSFRTGVPEQELLDACLRHFIEYFDEHGHIPFQALPDPARNEAN